MVILSEFRMGKYRDDDCLGETPYFTTSVEEKLAEYFSFISLQSLAECILFIHTTTNINRGWVFYATSSILSEYCFHPWICRFRNNPKLLHFS